MKKKNEVKKEEVKEEEIIIKSDKLSKEKKEELEEKIKELVKEAEEEEASKEEPKEDSKEEAEEESETEKEVAEEVEEEDEEAPVEKAKKEEEPEKKEEIKKEKDKKDKEKKTIVCKKCNVENPYGVKRCLNCGEDLMALKVCPRCAKINDAEVENCIRCGYSFASGNRSLVVNFILSCILVSSLIIINKYDGMAFKGLTSNMKKLAVIGVVLILIATLTYGRKDRVKYSAEENIIDNTKVLKVRKYTSIVLGILLAAIFIYVCFKYLI